MRALTHLAALVALATVGLAVGDWASHTNVLGAVGILLLIAAFALLLSFLYRPARVGAPAQARTMPRRRRRSAATPGAAGWDAAEAGVARSHRRGSRGADDRRVDLNRAGEDELAALPGVGPVAARRIVGEREANGAFSTVSDLARVPGFNPAKVRALSVQARV